VHFHHRQTYRLRFVNWGSSGHNFAAPECFAVSISSADPAAIWGGRVEVGKGESRTARLIPAASNNRVACTHFLHASFGIAGSIAVN